MASRCTSFRSRWSRLLATLAVSFGAIPSAHALVLQVTPTPPSPVGQSVAFEVTASEADGEVTYEWDFGDGTELTAQPNRVSHQYSSPGHYPVIVKARDASTLRSRGFMLIVHRPLPATPPSSSGPLALDVERRRVWSVNPDADTVSAFDVTTREKLFEVPTDVHPRSLARAPDGSFWVVNQDSHSLTIHDAATGARTGSVSLDYASRPFGIVIHGTNAYVSLEATSRVARIDTMTREVTGRAEVGPMPRGISVTADGRELFVARFISPDANGEVYRVDAASMTAGPKVLLAFDQHPDAESNGRGVPNYLAAAALSPDGQSLFIPSKKDNIARGLGRDGIALNFESSVRTILSRIDLTSGQEDAPFRIDFNNFDSASVVAFSPLGDVAFVGLQGSNRVEIVDAYSGALIGGILDVGRAPQGLLVFENTLFVHGFLSRELAFFDVTSVLDATDYSGALLGRTSAVAVEKLSPQVLRGKQVFYDSSDPRMSLDGYISCASCHVEGLDDGRVWDFTDRGEGFRNTTSLLGRAGTAHGPVHWSANFDEIQDFEHDMRGPFGGTGFLSEEQFSAGTRNTTLGDPKAGLNEELDALAAYVTSLDRIPPSPFRNSDGTLTTAGVRGRALFESLDCQRCHSGTIFTDSPSRVRHDVGTIGPKSGQRLGGPLDGLDTPTLLGIWQTPPYLHDGSAQTLADVFTRSGAELHAGRALSATEVEDLVAYLQQVDGLPDVGQPPMAGAGGLGGAAGMPSAAGMPGVGGVGGMAGVAGSEAIAGSGDAGTPAMMPAAPSDADSGAGCSVAWRADDRSALGSLGALLALAALRVRSRRRLRRS
jgi:DNA-binding beta-propeller fold protein YncE